MIGIVDYGLGNLRSVAGAVEKVGFEARVACDLETLTVADKLILPGVGAFGDGMANLSRRGLVGPLTEMVMERGKPLLGICLGSQLIAKRSEEFGAHEGLGWIDAEVLRLQPADPELRVPHVGWNEVRQVRPCPLFEGVPDASLFYFVHSYRLEAADPALVVGTCDYGGPVVAVVRRANVYATQFHPEKSQKAGLALLKNFLELG
jgi:glutamine amidotransferase